MAGTPEKILIKIMAASGGRLENQMKRKPDILVVLAALLGIGMVLSSFSGVSVAETQTQQVQVSSVK